MFQETPFPRTRASLFLVLFAVMAAVLPACATTLNVDCQGKKNNSINAALASLTKQGPHTVNITGACTESVVIDTFDNLTLVGTPGASITFPAGPDDFYTIFIRQSRNITVRDITINGGVNGILCGFFSHCTFYNITVQNAEVGISFARSTGTIGDNALLQNNLFAGASVVRNSHVRFGAWPENGGATIVNNGNATDGGEGVYIDDESYVDLFNSTVQDNDYGDGVTLAFGSFLGISNTNITSNGGNGVSVIGSSIVRLRGSGVGGINTITGNGGNGIALSHLSYLQINGPRNVSGNGATDVSCNASTAKTQGTGGSATPNLGGGTTNCTEPAP